MLRHQYSAGLLVPYPLPVLLPRNVAKPLAVARLLVALTAVC